MKTPTARKLPSGSWFVRVRVDGQDIGITRPTEKEAVAEAMAIKAGIMKEAHTPQSAKTLAAAIECYILQRENILSPTTIAGYRVIQRNRFQSLLRTRICDITPQKWQSAVNQEAKRIGAKTLKNSAMFVQSVIRDSGGADLSARLPQVVQHDLPWLDPDQIQTFLDAVRGSRYEIPALLALSGLRQSEIIGLHWSDIDTDAETITVSGTGLPQTGGGIVFREENKNTSSRRTVPFLIPQLREAVIAARPPQDGHVYPHYNNVLRLNINRLCAANGLPEVGVHGLRRSFASLCYHLGIPEEITMIAGGWSELRTMRKIYTRVSERDIAMQAQVFKNFFDNENGNGK